MLRPKRLTPSRPPVADQSGANPLHSLRREFVSWSTAVGLSPLTAKIRDVALGYFVRWCDVQRVESPRQISLTLLEQYQVHVSTVRKRDGHPLAATTQSARLNPIMAFCKWLVRRRILRKDPSMEMKLQRHFRRIPGRVPTVLEIERIMAQPDTRRLQEFATAR